MSLRDLRAKFKSALPVSKSFFKLMQGSFDFYTSLCTDFLDSLSAQVEAGTLDEFLQNSIRPRLFDKDYCKNIEKTKRRFLAENIKLKEFIKTNNFKEVFINDLVSLKKVSKSIYELLQTHWEIFKYQDSMANNKTIIAFILEIDRIGINWDSYLEKYLAISNILQTSVEEDVAGKGFRLLMAQYHLPKKAKLTTKMSNDFLEFLEIAFEFILGVAGAKPQDNILEVINLEMGSPVNCILKLPAPLFENYKKFLNYLSLDVLKRETLVKFVMEVISLRQGQALSKAAISSYQKKIAKRLGALYPKSFMSVEENKIEDSVSLLGDLCKEMEELNINYKDIMTGSSKRLTRNRKAGFAEMINPIQKPPQNKKNVKVDVKNKEHIQYLTS